MITNEQGRPLTPEEAESVALGLEKKGLIYRTGEQRLGRDGKMWDVWALSAAGKAELMKLAPNFRPYPVVSREGTN